MSRSAHVTLDWAGKPREFRLAIADLQALQEATDRGPMDIFARLSGGTWTVGEVSAVLTFGLVGGGLPLPQARALVARVFVPPLAEHVPIAIKALSAALVGAPDEPVGKASAASPRAEATDAFGSPPSSASAP